MISRAAIANSAPGGGLLANDSFLCEWYVRVVPRFFNTGPDNQLIVYLEFEDGQHERWEFRLDVIRFWKRNPLADSDTLLERQTRE